MQLPRITSMVITLNNLNIKLRLTRITRIFLKDFHEKINYLKDMNELLNRWQCVVECCAVPIGIKIFLS